MKKFCFWALLLVGSRDLDRIQEQSDRRQYNYERQQQRNSDDDYRQYLKDWQKAGRHSQD